MSEAVVVTVVHGRHEHLARQREGLRRLADGPRAHVVVRMGDDVTPPDHGELPTVLVDVPTTSAGLPLAAARNRGVAEALRLDPALVVLLDVDCVPGPQLLARYEAAAHEHADALLNGPVTYLDPPPPGGYDLDDLPELTAPHAARPAPPDGVVERAEDGHALFWSLSFALTPGTWERIGGFDEAYVGYGGEDTDLAERARVTGVPMAWVGGAHAYHQWHPVSRPPVEHLADIVRNATLFHERWGWWPMTGWLEAFAERGLVAHDDGAWRVA